MSRKTSQGDGRPAWMNEELLTKFRLQKDEKVTET